jgi:AcrR family transcriptional regulator
MQSGIEGRRRAAMAEGGEAYKARREEIVRAAADVFRDLGYEASTLNDIAERLGTDRASLYYYVGSKEELLHEIVSSVLKENVATAERVAKSDAPAIEKMTKLLEEMMLSFDRNYPHMYIHIEDLALISRLNSEWAVRVRQRMKVFESIVLGIFEQGRMEGSFRTDLPIDISAFALFGMVNWTHRWYKPGSRLSAEDIAAIFASIFLDGYAKERPKGRKAVPRRAGRGTDTTTERP